MKIKDKTACKDNWESRNYQSKKANNCEVPQVWSGDA